ncbi:WD40 repeat-like protein, partial [Aureobasidium melanogenum]
MSRRGPVTVDLSKESPPPPEPQSIRHLQHVPDSRFITPDSDDEIEVLWEMRKQRNDESSSNTLRSNAGHHSSTIRPTVQKSHPVLPSSVTKKVVAQAPPTQPNTTGASNQPAPARPGTVRPPASVPSANRPPLPFIPTQARYNSPVSIANPSTKDFLVALSKSARSTPSASARPTLPPGAKSPVPSSRPRLGKPLPTPPKVPQPHVPRSTAVEISTGPAVSHHAQPTQPIRQSQPQPVPAPSPIGRLAPPLLRKPSKALLQDGLKSSAKSRDHPQEVLSQSRNVPSLIVPSSGYPALVESQASSSVAAANSSAHMTSQSQPLKKPMALHSSSQMAPTEHVPSPAEKHPPVHKAQVIEIDSSSEDGSVTTVNRSKSIGNAPLSHNSPRPEKRKVMEVPHDDDDDEPVKRLRRTHSSAIQPEDPLQDDVVDSVEVNTQPAFTFPTDISKIPPFSNNYGQPFTPEEDALIVHLKEVARISWKEFEPFFPGRKWPSMQTSSMGAQAYMDNASGDVSTIAWSPNGSFFAAGAVAVTDIQSIDYNKPRNLVVGSVARQNVKELAHHTIQHSLPDGRRKELFSTVQMVAFSPDSRYMYSAGIDQHLHKYRVDGSPSNTTLVHRVEHPASVDFLSVSNGGLVATGCASSGSRSINVLAYDDDALVESVCFSGTQQTKKTPSALKWGSAHSHQHYLLAGFSKEAEVFYIEDDHRDKEGEVALWDINTKQRIETDAPNRNVFDLAWNPNPGGNSSIFAVASRPVSHVGHGIHSVVRLYSPQQTRAHHTMELDCPAWDINDVVYSPHDNNLIAVGSSEGRIYVWDVRFAKHGQSPLNTLKHGESLAVMPHEKKRWEVDTGIRFLSWGSERDRLYSGSSDGLVACWDPYRSDSDKPVREVVRLNSAVMSGAFSPDFSHLLVGEDAARLNLLSVGNDGATF